MLRSVFLFLTERNRPTAANVVPHFVDHSKLSLPFLHDWNRGGREKAVSVPHAVDSGCPTAPKRPPSKKKMDPLCSARVSQGWFCLVCEGFP